MAEWLVIVSYLLGLAFLLLLSASFSGSETALFSLSRTEARRMREGTAAERAITRLLAEPQRLLSTLLVGNMLVNVTTASLIAGLARRLLGERGLPYAIGISTALLLLFGEVTPKTVAVRHAPAFSRLLALPLLWFSSVVKPLRLVLRLVVRTCLRAIGLGDVKGWESVTHEDIIALLDLGEEQGVTVPGERGLAERILNLPRVMAYDIMVPRTGISGVSDALTVGQAYETACRRRHSRLPVYHRDLDDIWGFVSVNDLARWRATEVMDRPLGELREAVENRTPDQGPVYPVLVVPDTARVGRLLNQMREQHSHLAVLVDEYGGTAGLLTMADVLSEVLGQLTTTAEPVLRVVRDQELVVDGGLHLRQLDPHLDRAVRAEEAETVGGLVMEELGRLPRSGDVVEAGDYRFEVVRMTGKRVGTVHITALPAGTGTGEGT
jgi:CBS domain containing-hemolysin-like protein